MELGLFSTLATFLKDNLSEFGIRKFNTLLHSSLCDPIPDYHSVRNFANIDSKLTGDDVRLLMKPLDKIWPLLCERKYMNKSFLEKIDSSPQTPFNIQIKQACTTLKIENGIKLLF
jgi:hypothetical protein